MKYITGNQLMALFKKGIPIIVEVSPEVVTHEGLRYENSLCVYSELCPNMRATVVDVKGTPFDSEVLTVLLDVSDWAEYNRAFDLPNHYEGGRDKLYWYEMDAYPKNGIVEGFVDSDDMIYSFTIVEVHPKTQGLYEEFGSSGYDNYVKWLETQLLELRDEADQLAAL